MGLSQELKGLFLIPRPFLFSIVSRVSLWPPWSRSQRKGELSLGPCSGFTQPLSSVPGASLPLLCSSSVIQHISTKHLCATGWGWVEGKAPDLEELRVVSEPLVRAPEAIREVEMQGKGEPGPEMFRLFQKEKQHNKGTLNPLGQLWTWEARGGCPTPAR